MESVAEDFKYEGLPGANKKIKFFLYEIRSNFDLTSEKISVLDVGCGNGGISFAIASQGYDVLGTDIDEASIDFATSHWVLPNLNFLLTRGDLSEVDGQYDVIILSEVLEHLDDPEQILGTIKQKQKKKCLILITTPNGYGPREILGRLERLLRKNKTFDKFLDKIKESFGVLDFDEKRLLYTSSYSVEHVQKFSYRSLKRLLKHNGLNILKKVNSFFLFSIFFKKNRAGSFIEKFDCKIADLMPAAIVSGWYIACLLDVVNEIFNKLPID
ncbi:MAG: methyltransferase domain-containing protein [Actinobacteria bacterium]|nr:methyltransferase domain-containing protein [Actinomycetota bacterium]